MLSKIIIVAFLVAILLTLASGLFTMYKDDASQTRTLTALKWRVGLSLLLFLLLVVGLKTGVIESHKNPLLIPPPETNEPE